jgi:hypothetical protein
MVFASRDSANAVVSSVKPIGRVGKAAPVDAAASKVAELGDGGLKVIWGTVAHIDPANGTISVAKTDGTLQTLHLSSEATDDASLAAADGARRSTKVSIYYTEEGGLRTAQFIERAL